MRDSIPGPRRLAHLAPCTGPGPVSVLSDGAILRLVEEGRITIKPWDAERVQPASVDLRLGDSFRVFHNHRTTAIDLRDPPANLTEEVVVGRATRSSSTPASSSSAARSSGSSCPTTSWRGSRARHSPSTRRSRRRRAGSYGAAPDRGPGLRRARPPYRGHRCDRGHDRPRVPRGRVLRRHEPRRATCDHQWEVQTKYDRKRRQRAGHDDPGDGGPPSRRRSRVRVPCPPGGPGALRAQAPAHRPLRARSLARRRHQHEGRGHARSTRRSSASSSSPATRCGPPPRRSPIASAAPGTREMSAPAATPATTPSRASCATWASRRQVHPDRLPPGQRRPAPRIARRPDGHGRLRRLARPLRARRRSSPTSPTSTSSSSRASATGRSSRRRPRG